MQQFLMNSGWVNLIYKQKQENGLIVRPRLEKKTQEV